MATTVLGVTARTTPEVRTYANTTPTVQGVTFGAADSTASPVSVSTLYSAFHRVVRFGGFQTFIATSGLGIYRSTDGGASWSLVHTWSGSSTSAARSGLYVVDIGGVPTLAAFCYTGASAFHGATSTNGTSWTQVGPFSATWSAGSNPHASLLYHGVIYLAHSHSGILDTRRVSFFNPATASGGGFDASVATGGFYSGLDLCVFNDTLYVIAKNNLSLFAVYDITTGSPVLFAALTGIAFSNTASIYNRPAAFVDGAFMYVFSFGALGTIEAWKLDSVGAGGSSPLGTAVLPPALRAGVPNTARLFAHVDYDSNPASPTKYLLYAPNGITGTTMVMYRWNGDAALMTVEDTGGDIAHAVGYANFPLGSHSFSVGQLAMDRVGLVALVGAEQHSFVLRSVSGSEIVKVRAHIGIAQAEGPGTSATLSNPSTGGVMNGNTVETWVADNVTVRTVRWQAATDGFAPNQRRKIWFEIFQ